MNVFNIKHPDEVMSFCAAARQGAGRDNGLFMPVSWPRFDDMDKLLELDRAELWRTVYNRLLGEEIGIKAVEGIVDEAFNFPLLLKQVAPQRWVLELFHGPTLAFKDFGARFLAKVLALTVPNNADKKITILTATSGDTGAAVAHAFHGIPGIRVVILYPSGRVSPLQEKLFATLGGNVSCLKVRGNFDDCQALAKACFADAELSSSFALTSANSINIARLIAQVSYYVAGVAEWRRQTGSMVSPTICVPCGNFGNLTAGLLAWRLGLPVQRFLVATNSNDVVPAFLDGNPYRTRPSVPTPANAMDVGAPNNWPRICSLFENKDELMRSTLLGDRVTDTEIYGAMQGLYDLGYMADPHGAVAWEVMQRHLPESEPGIFLETAHPGKFAEVAKEHLNLDVELPDALRQVKNKTVLAHEIRPEIEDVVSFLETFN